MEQAARGLLDRMLDRWWRAGHRRRRAGTSSPAPGSALAAYVTATRPAVEVVVYDGQQPHYPVLLGVE